MQLYESIILSSVVHCLPTTRKLGINSDLYCQSKFTYTLLQSHTCYNFNPLNAELYPICHLLALLRAHHILHVSRVRVKIQNQSRLRLNIQILHHSKHITCTLYNPELILFGKKLVFFLSEALETHSALSGKMQTSFDVTAGVMIEPLCSEVLQRYRKLQNVKHFKHDNENG